MTKRTKLYAWIAAGVVGVGSAIAIVIVKLIRSGVGAVKVAPLSTVFSGVGVAKVVLLSTVLVTVAAPFVVADKGYMVFVGGVAETMRFSEDWASMAGNGRLDEAQKQFKHLRNEMTTKGKDTSVLVGAWMIAAAQNVTVPQVRTEAIDFLMNEYPHEALDKHKNYRPFAIIGAGLWRYFSPEQALTYSMGMLRQLPENPENHKRAIWQILQDLPKLKGTSSETFEARKAFVRRCSEVFPPSLTESGKELDMALCLSIGLELAIVEGMEAGGKYLETTLALFHPKAEGKTQKAIPKYIKKIVQRSVKKFHGEPLGYMMILMNKYAPGLCGKECWIHLARTIDPDDWHDYYTRLLKAHGTHAVGFGESILNELPKGLTIQEVLADRVEIMVSEIEAGAESAALNRLIQELKGRNAFVEIEQVTEFLWKNLPTEPIGSVAFRLWALHQNEIGGDMILTQEARELIECYPSYPIAHQAKLTLARSFISQGRVLEGLLMVAEAVDKGMADDEDVVTIPLLRKLVNRYVTEFQDMDVEVKYVDILLALADQLGSIGEKAVANIIYWKVTQSIPVRILDPRYNLPLDPPGSFRQSELSKDYKTKLWRVLALIALDRLPEAEWDLAPLLKVGLDHDFIGISRFWLVRKYRAKGQPFNAKSHIEAFPEDIIGTQKGSVMYGELKKLSPTKVLGDHTQHLEQEIKQIEAALFDNPDIPGADGSLMRLGRLFSRKGQYAKAVSKYEMIQKRYPKSPYCPEAIYQAIAIYETRLARPDRAKYLIEVLKSKYTGSYYRELIDEYIDNAESVDPKGE